MTELNKEDNNIHIKVDERKDHFTSTLHKELQATKGCWKREKESTSEKSISVGSVLRTHIQVKLNRLNSFYLVCTHKHTY